MILKIVLLKVYKYLLNDDNRIRLLKNLTN